MALVKCHECNNDVSTEAKQCVHCGVTVKVPAQWTGLQKVIMGVLLSLIGLIVIGRMVDNPSSRAAKRPAIQVQAGEILAAYQNNEVAADRRYKGRIVEVSGVVGDIGKDVLGKVYVTLGTGAALEIPVVQCTLAGEWARAAANFSKGQRLKVRGEVNGLLMNVLIDDGVIVQ